MEIKKNKGYSLVELLIVIAIIVILAGVSLISLTLVNTARAKDASNKFGSEVSQVRKKCMDMKPSKGNIPKYDDDKDYRYGLVLYLKDGKFQTDQVIVTKDSSTGNYVYNDKSNGIKNSYPAYDASGNPQRENVQYSSRVEVKFTGQHSSFRNGSNVQMNKAAAGAITTDEAVCITFDRHGNCLSGDGEYLFFKKDSTQVARVIIRQNGNIEVR